MDVANMELLPIIQRSKVESKSQLILSLADAMLGCYQ